MKIMLFNSNGPSAELTIISQRKCPETLLKMCNIPDDARQSCKNLTRGQLLKDEGVFVRGVNSSFYEVEINNENYYVHEQYVRRDI